MKKQIRTSRYVFLTLTVLTAALIFYLSSQNGEKSADTSGLLIENLFGNIFEKLGINLSDIAVFAAIDHIVRKLAHFSEYAILGFCTAGFLSTFDKPKYFTGIVALTSGFLYACTDEFHQYFVPARSAQFTDVLIDSSGVLTGTAIFIIIIVAAEKIKQKKNTKRQADQSGA